MKPSDFNFRQLKQLLFVALFSICALTQTTAQTSYNRETDSLALVAFYNATDGPNWTNNTNWLTGNIDAWYGISISNNRVWNITIRNNKIIGTIPPEIRNLSELKLLRLSNNQLCGQIPPEIGNLKKLTSLELSSNQLTGSIPPELANNTLLTAISLYRNSLSGNIPPELGRLNSLNYLDLSQNELSGSIPSEFGNLTRLNNLWLNNNKLSGSIPPELGGLISLACLVLNDNMLNGTIPPDIGKMINLEYLSLNNNQLTGSIPPEIGDITKLIEFHTSYNKISGSIPPEIGQLNKLSHFEASNNQLSGSIPEEIGNLKNLTDLRLSYNQLSGSIPEGIGGLVSSIIIILDYNQLSGSIPSAVGNLSNLMVLSLENNSLSGPIPEQIKNLNALSALNIRYNKFVFSDLENSTMLPGDISHFIYYPQANVAPPVYSENGNKVVLAVIDTAEFNHYYWIVNNSPVISYNSSSYSFVPTELSTVYVKITNDVYSSLILKTEPITIEPFIDTIAPTVIVRDITIYLNETGNAFITPGQIDKGSNDASGIASMVLSQTDFDCSHIGPITVTLTVTDMSGNSASAEATVTVVDDIAPVAVAKDVTLFLDQSGSVTLTEDMVDNGSTDNCGIGSISISQAEFDCSHIGPNTITLTVSDMSGNSASAEASVTVVDDIAPVAVAKNVTLFLDQAESVILTEDQVNNGSTDNCGIESISISQAEFDCSNVGENQLLLSVSDASGNVSVSEAVVTVIDRIFPAITAPANISIEVLSEEGVAVEPGEPEVYDNCTIESIENDAPSLFFPGTTVVTWTVTDAGGNSAKATQEISIIFVSPNELPVIHSITSNSPVYIQDAAEVTATFSDDNPETATWDWGDGSSSEGLIMGQQVTGSHYYSETGLYDVTLTIEDAYEEMASLVYSYMVVYDPELGHISGGGWIDSETGDYHPSPESGKANYGFTVQYDQDFDLKGNLTFHLNSAKFKVSSTLLEWLMVSYDQAIFKGQATVNNEPGYEFLVSVIDGQIVSENEPDLFRIIVWETGGEIIYDNQGGEIISNRATDPVQGTVIIHENDTESKGNKKSANLSDQESFISQGDFVVSPNIYPNPVSTCINVNIPERQEQSYFFDIVDISGRVIVRNQYLPFHGQKGKINLEEMLLNQGLYILKIKDIGGNQTFQFCFEKE